MRKVEFIKQSIKRKKCLNCNALIESNYYLINGLPICECCYHYHNLGILHDITQEERERLIFLSEQDIK